jgi:RNA polymerase sigma-70 factor (ECF subfamily)
MDERLDNKPNGTSADGSLNGLLVAVGERRDRAAFAAIFGHFAPRIKAYLMRRGADQGTAEEVVQEVMVTLWRRADRYDPAQSDASTWVFTIARNKRIDLLRRERRPELDPDDPALTPAAGPAADHAVEAAQDAGRIRSAIRVLPDEQKELLHMAFFEDKPHSVIAAERNLPLGTVKSRIRLAMSRLRKELKEEE